MKYWYWGGIAVVVLLMVVGGLLFAEPYSLRGSTIDPPVPAPDFTLTDMNRDALKLSVLQGNIVLIFFGFTTCPDVCPTTLAEMRQMYELLGEKSEGVSLLFITVDPQRDTPDRLKSYVTAFHPDFIGLTGEEDDLQKVWKDYGVYRQIRDEGSAAGYLVDHSAQVYLVDQNGNLRVTYAFGTPVEDIEKDIRYILKEQK